MPKSALMMTFDNNNNISKKNNTKKKKKKTGVLTRDIPYKQKKIKNMSVSLSSQLFLI
jgi:hypothetical protein